MTTLNRRSLETRTVRASIAWAAAAVIFGTLNAVAEVHQPTSASKGQHSIVERDPTERDFRRPRGEGVVKGLLAQGVRRTQADAEIVVEPVEKTPLPEEKDEAPSFPPLPTQQHSFDDQVDDRRVDSDRHFSELEDRLDQLDQLLQLQALEWRRRVEVERRRAADRARQEAERIAAEKLADSLMPPPEVPRVMKEPTPSQPVPVVVPSDDSVPPEDEDSQRTQVLSQEPTYPDSPRDITAEPIDRTALADNLFASGKFELAMKIYRDLVVVNPKTADDVWHHYQLACCYRHLGSIQEAEKHYRIVAGSKEDEHLAENARWWLDWLQKQTEASQKLNLLRSSLEQLLKEFPDDQPSQ